MEFTNIEKHWLDEQVKRYSDRIHLFSDFEQITFVNPVKRFDTTSKQKEYPLCLDYFESHHKFTFFSQNGKKNSKSQPSIQQQKCLSDLELNKVTNLLDSNNIKQQIDTTEKKGFKDIILNLPIGLQNETDKIYENPYWEWLSLLQNGFNIILYGLGSKMDILNFFQNNFLKDGICCNINGNNEKFDFKDFLTELMIFLHIPIIDPVYKRKLLPKQLCHHLSICSRPLYLIINNIDSNYLNDYFKDLAYLSSLPMVHLISSVSHLHFELNWNSYDLAKFNFIYKQCSSRLDYRNELLEIWKQDPPSWFIFENFESKNNEIQFDIILGALTSNHQRLIKIIAAEQLKNPTHQAILEETIFSNNSAFVIGMDRSKLNKLLVELISYQILHKFVSSRGKMSFLIPAGREHLKKLANKNY